jgi:hypothetical protein
MNSRAHLAWVVITIFIITMSQPECRAGQTIYWLDNHRLIRILQDDTGAPAAVSVWTSHWSNRPLLADRLIKAGVSPLSPNGEWLIGYGFGQPYGGHSGSRLYIGFNLSNFQKRYWPRVDEGATVWSSDSRSFYIANSWQSKTIAHHFFVDSPVVTPISVHGPREWLIGETLDRRLVWLDAHPDTALTASSIKLWGSPNGKLKGFSRTIRIPAALEISDCYYNCFSNLVVLLVRRGSVAGSYKSSCIICDLTTSNPDSIGRVAYSGSKYFDSLAVSPNGTKAVLFSSGSSTYHIVCLCVKPH